MAIKFNQPVKHGRHLFTPGATVSFKDKDAEAYFKAAGWATASRAKVQHTYSAGEVEIDPETVFATGNKRGQRVLGGRP